jgi:hypothetical protein
MVVGANKKTNTKISMMAMCEPKEEHKKENMVIIMN